MTVRGIVTSADDKQPLIGVNVISGATSGVSTLADGSYSISVAAGSTLTFQYIGYKPATFTVPGGSASLTYNVSLESEAQALDDVVVIAYGVRKKGTIAGSVSTVKAEKVENTPTAAFDQAIQGQVPGLTVLSNSGEPSTSATMMILYILDGVAIASSDFNTINPADIESISVLKDASSTSIYGARAANGVIVITTKRGRMAERAKINYRMQLGFSQIAYGNWDLMDTRRRSGSPTARTTTSWARPTSTGSTRCSTMPPCSRTTSSRFRGPPTRPITTSRAATTTRRASP